MTDAPTPDDMARDLAADLAYALAEQRDFDTPTERDLAEVAVAALRRAIAAEVRLRELLDALAPFCGEGADLRSCWRDAAGEVTSGDPADRGRAESYEVYVTREQMDRLLRAVSAVRGQE